MPKFPALKNQEDARKLHTIDALRFSLALVTRAYRSLLRSLKSIEKADKNGRSNPSLQVTLGALSHCWGMIDHANRARGLVLQVRGLRHHSPEVQAFLRGTEEVEDFRNLIQHLDSHIGKISGLYSPILGAISWVTENPKVSFSIAPGPSSRENQFHTLAVDTTTLNFVGRLVLTAGNQDIHLDNLVHRCNQLTLFLNSWFKQCDLLSEDEQGVAILRFNIEKLRFKT